MLGAEPEAVGEDGVGDIGNAMVSRSGMFSHEHQCLIGSAVCLHGNALSCSRDLCGEFVADFGYLHRRFTVRGYVFVSSGGYVVLEEGDAVVAVVAGTPGTGPWVDTFEVIVGGCPTSSAVPAKPPRRTQIHDQM